MDHSHMDHGNMPSQHRCSMNMLFTWDTTDLCLVFRSWHITNTLTLILSLLAVVALTAGYEAVRELSRRYERRVNEKLDGMPRLSRSNVERSAKVGKALFYGIQVFYSFFIMLLFMTYNGWVMLAVAVGAFVGFLLFAPSGAPGTKDVACH